MLSNKTIRNKSVEDFVEMCYEVSKWIDAFNSNGKVIFGDDYDIALAFSGLAIGGMTDGINTFMDNAEAFAKKHNEMKVQDLLRQFNIKLEGDDTKPS